LFFVKIYIYDSLEDNFETHGFEPVLMPLAIDNAYLYVNSEHFLELIKICGAVITFEGIQDMSDNTVEKQTWKFNGIES